jgi:hypothetical protein
MQPMGILPATNVTRAYVEALRQYLKIDAGDFMGIHLRTPTEKRAPKK